MSGGNHSHTGGVFKTRVELVSCPEVPHDLCCDEDLCWRWLFVGSDDFFSAICWSGARDACYTAIVCSECALELGRVLTQCLEECMTSAETRHLEVVGIDQVVLEELQWVCKWLAFLVTIKLQGRFLWCGSSWSRLSITLLERADIKYSDIDRSNSRSYYVNNKYVFNFSILIRSCLVIFFTYLYIPHVLES